MRAINRLSTQTIKAAAAGKHCDGAGLWIYKRDDGGAAWVLRVTIHGRRREMGLGGFPTLGLKEARKAAERWRKVAAEGYDPIKVRAAEERAKRREDISLAIITADAFEARKAELKGGGSRWLSPLTHHVLPKLGRVPVTDIDQRDIRDTLAPIWHTKAETAHKALIRLAIVMRHAAALGRSRHGRRGANRQAGRGAVSMEDDEIDPRVVGVAAIIEKHLPATSRDFQERKLSEAYADRLLDAHRYPLTKFGLRPSLEQWARLRRAAREFQQAIVSLNQDAVREIQWNSPHWWKLENKPLSHEAYMVADLLIELAVNRHAKLTHLGGYSAFKIDPPATLTSAQKSAEERAGATDGKRSEDTAFDLTGWPEHSVCKPGDGTVAEYDPQVSF